MTTRKGTRTKTIELRHYLAGLLGESERKNITQIANNNLAITYHKLHHFMTDSPTHNLSTRRESITLRRAGQSFHLGHAD